MLWLVQQVHTEAHRVKIEASAWTEPAAGSSNVGACQLFLGHTQATLSTVDAHTSATC